MVRLLAAELGDIGVRVNGINPDGVVRGSGIFAGGWGASRATTYGVAEEDLGKYYAQRTVLKEEVLPEHVASAVVALTNGTLPITDRADRAGGLRRPRRRSCDDRDDHDTTATTTQGAPQDDQPGIGIHALVWVGGWSAGAGPHRHRVDPRGGLRPDRAGRDGPGRASTPP